MSTFWHAFWRKRIDKIWKFWKITFLMFLSKVRWFFSYRDVLYLKMIIKTFWYDLIFFFLAKKLKYFEVWLRIRVYFFFSDFTPPKYEIASLFPVLCKNVWNIPTLEYWIPSHFPVLCKMSGRYLLPLNIGLRQFFLFYLKMSGTYLLPLNMDCVTFPCFT